MVVLIVIVVADLPVWAMTTERNGDDVDGHCDEQPVVMWNVCGCGAVTRASDGD